MRAGILVVVLVTVGCDLATHTTAGRACAELCLVRRERIKDCTGEDPGPRACLDLPTCEVDESIEVPLTLLDQCLDDTIALTCDLVVDRTPFTCIGLALQCHPTNPEECRR